MKKTLSLILGILMMLTVAPMQIFAESNATEWDGSITAPTKLTAIDGIYYYEIYTPAELAYIAETGGDWLSYNYILKNDIVLNAEELTCDEEGNLTVDTSTLNMWTPLSTFDGIFDGNGFSISGMCVVSAENYVGFVGKLTDTIKNLTIKNSYVKGNEYVGGFVGYTNEGTIENCSYYGNVKGKATFYDCYVGGIVGYSDSSISSCTNNGNVNGTGDSVGGIAGDSHGSISSCTNNGDVNGAGDYVGGIAGNSWGSYISSCTNNGNVNGTGDRVGGIAGKSYSSISFCTNNGNVNGAGDRVGGIAGWCDYYDPINSCTNNGDVTGNNYVAGVCGLTDNSISNSKNTGKIVGKEYVGGLVGKKGSSSYTETISGYNFGEIEGTNNVGGIAGYVTDCDLENCYNVANVKGETSVGGVAGYSGTAWGKGTSSGCIYLKNNEINANLNGYGAFPDIDGVVNAKSDDELCINREESEVSLEHTFGEDESNICIDCGYNKNSGIVLPDFDFDEYIDVETATMPNVVEDTTAEEIISKLTTYGITATVTDKDGNALKSEDTVGTGCMVTDQNGNTYTVIVKGDSDGNGKITSTDYLQIKNSLIGKTKLSGAYLTAADTDDNGDITATDYLHVKGHFTGKSDLYA